MILNRSRTRLIAFVLLLFTAAALIAVPAASLEIYIPDTAEIPDPEITTPSDSFETERPSEPWNEEPEQPEGTETKKEKETVPTPVNYTKELIAPAAIMLVLAVAVFAVSFYIKYRKRA